MSIISFHDALLDPNLFGSRFSADSWAGWRTIAKAVFGEPLNESELAFFREVAGRDEAPTSPASEAFLVVGRRGGKDAFAAALAVYLATLGAEKHGWRKRLSKGERGVVQLLAVDRDQAQVAFRYIASYFDEPIFAKLVKRRAADTIELTNSLSIEVTTADQRRVRGRTVVAAIFDELSHWRSENTVSPDEDVYRAVKPSMATMPGAMLIGISSPYARKALLWKKYQAHYGKPGNVLVIKAPTWVMNPTLPRDGEFIAGEFEADPAYASAEFGAEFRTDVEALFTLEVIEACIEPGVTERPPQRGYYYYAFCDPSGGSSDSMTLGIAHKEGSVAVLDCIREIRPPFDPEKVVVEFVEAMKRYGVGRVFGDRYGGTWVASTFTKAGIAYIAADRSKSEIYLDVVPQVNAGKVKLLDEKRLKHQLVSLERRVGRGTGRDIIDHPSGAGQHDDVANAAAGALIAMGFHDRHIKAEPIKPALPPPGSMGITAAQAFNPPNRENRIQL